MLHDFDLKENVFQIWSSEAVKDMIMVIYK